jgi:putative flippase GtrA
MNTIVPPLNRLFLATFGKFLTVGLLNTAITIAVIFSAKAWLGLDDIVSNAFGYVAGMLCSFLLNKFWTFSHRGQAFQALIRFLAVSGVAYLVNLAFLKTFLALGINAYLCQLLAMPFYTIVFFLGSRAIVFVKDDVTQTSGRWSLVSRLIKSIYNSDLEKTDDALKHTAFFCLALITALVALFYRLTALPIELWDESRLANNALEMSQTGLSFITTYQWLPDHWNTKPPLLIWIMAATMKVAGINELSVRLPSVIAALATLSLVYWFIVRHFRLPVQALLTVLFILAAPGYVLFHGARSGNYDALLTLFTTVYLLSAFLFMEGEERNRWKYFSVMVVAIIATFYTKSIQGLIFLPALFAYALANGHVKMILRKRYFYIGCILVLASSIFYYWFRNKIDPGYFSAAQANDLGGRYSVPQEGHDGSPFYYLRKSIRFFPWLIPSLVIGAYLCLRGPRELKKFALFISMALVSYFLVISSASTKLVWYATPIVPLSAILCAFGVGKLAATRWANIRGKGQPSVALLCIAGTISVITFNIVQVNSAITRRPENPHDLHSYALRSLINSGEKHKALVVLHPGYLSGEESEFYVAPTMFYANTLTIAGTPTTIVRNASEIDDEAAILTCGEEAPTPRANTKVFTENASKCVLYVSSSDTAMFH